LLIRFLIISLIASSYFAAFAQMPDSDAPASFLDRLWVSGQANFITQAHPSFFARYTGPNSLRPQFERRTSRVFTLNTGFQIAQGSEVLFDIESAGGGGVSDALGLAGFSNLDVVRNPTLGAAPYIARLMFHQVFALSDERVDVSRGPLQLSGSLPARRLEIRIGKMSTVDFFDVNSVGADSHSQFLNWTIDNNGAYDYAADTRGYTYGALLEFQDRNWGVRFSEALMPTVANGVKLDWNLARARGENLEFAFRRSLIGGRPGVLRPLFYVNHANMGSYREAIDAFLAGRDAAPDITAHRKQGRVKYGFGLNIEQEIGAGVRAYGRFGWNEGSNENFAYTEVNQAISGGADIQGGRWGRHRDKAGAAFSLNAISGDHRRYLALGGLGFLLGDGALNYGRERITEIYYRAHVWRGVSASLDLQRVWNPGYNRDRGPVLIPAVRLHLGGALFGAR
jgi:high affinity Mn2+ porin